MKNKKRVLALVLGSVFVLGSTVFLGSTTPVDEKLDMAKEITKKLFIQNLEIDLQMDVAEDEESVRSGFLSAQYLKGLDGEQDYILVKSSNKGYAIFDKESMELLEYSDKAKSPYEEVETENAYYAGPVNYYRKKDNKMQNMRTGKEIQEERCLEIANGVKDKIKTDRLERAQKQKEKEQAVSEEVKKEVSATSSAFASSDIKLMNAPTTDETLDADEYNYRTRRYIDYYQFFTDYDGMGNNTINSCVTVACQMLLAYNNWINDGRIIPYMEELNADRVEGEDWEIFHLYEYQQHTGRPTRTEKELQELLLQRYDNVVKGTSFEYNENDGIVTFYEKLLLYIHDFEAKSSTMYLADMGLSNYLQDYASDIVSDIEIDSLIAYFSYQKDVAQEKIISEIDNERPVVTSIYVYDEETGKNGGHAVVTYGYQNVQIQGQIQTGIICHYGWRQDRDKQHLWVNQEWITGYLSIQTKHLHGEEVPYIHGNSHILQCSTCGRIRHNDAHNYSNFESITEDGEETRAFWYHRGTCYCGVEADLIHDLSYRDNYDGYSHFASCQICNYMRTEEHAIKANSYCVYCGFSLD